MSAGGAGARKRVRMRDVAQHCGLSISTVSLVLSGDTRIPEETARRVHDAVKALEYRPSVLARSLARHTSRTLGVILPENAFTANPLFYMHVIEGVHSETQPAGYKIVIEAANPVFIARRYYLRLLKEQSVDGLLYLGAGRADGFLNDMEREPYPFLLGLGLPDGWRSTAARLEDSAGARLAVNHLLSLGHRQIAHLADRRDVSTGADREAGYREAMAAAKAPVDPSWVVDTGSDPAAIERAALALSKAGVTAIFAGTDAIALAAIGALARAGLRVPERMSVVGMDGIDLAQNVHPALTTVQLSPRALGAASARYLLRRIQSPISGRVTLADLPKPELVVRASCGPRL